MRFAEFGAPMWQGRCMRICDTRLGRWERSRELRTRLKEGVTLTTG